MKYLKRFEEINNTDKPEVGDYVILDVNNISFSNSELKKYYLKKLTNKIFKIIDYETGTMASYTINFYDFSHTKGWIIYPDAILIFDKDKEIIKLKNAATNFNL